MRQTLTLPDGRALSTSSAKRWHVVIEHANDPATLVRVTSTGTRSRALARWRAYSRRSRAWLIDAETGEHVRTPEHEGLLP
jgi:hypothetical protein